MLCPFALCHIQSLPLTYLFANKVTPIAVTNKLWLSTVLRHVRFRATATKYLASVAHRPILLPSSVLSFESPLLRFRTTHWRHSSRLSAPPCPTAQLTYIGRAKSAWLSESRRPCLGKIPRLTLTSFNFLGLPTELRLNVYEHLFSISNLKHQRCATPNLPRNVYFITATTGILSTCRGIYEEAGPVFMKQTSLEVWYDVDMPPGIYPRLR